MPAEKPGSVWRESPCLPPRPVPSRPCLSLRSCPFSLLLFEAVTAGGLTAGCLSGVQTPRNVRADKTHPNSMHTAESVLESIHSNLTESVLQILVVDKVKKLRQRTRQLLREAVRRGSVVAMDPDDRQTLNQVTMQLYQADPAIK